MTKTAIILWVVVLTLWGLWLLFSNTMTGEEKVAYSFLDHVPKRIQIINLIRFPLTLIAIVVTIIAIIKF